MFLKKLLGPSGYVSPIDEALMTFDKEHPKKSASQKREINKYAEIYRLRDNPNAKPTPPKFWDKF